MNAEPIRQAGAMIAQLSLENAQLRSHLAEVMKRFDEWCHANPCNDIKIDGMLFENLARACRVAKKTLEKLPNVPKVVNSPNG